MAAEGTTTIAFHFPDTRERFEHESRLTEGYCTILLAAANRQPVEWKLERDATLPEFFARSSRNERCHGVTAEDLVDSLTYRLITIVVADAKPSADGDLFFHVFDIYPFERKFNRVALIQNIGESSGRADVLRA